MQPIFINNVFICIFRVLIVLSHITQGEIRAELWKRKIMDLPYKSFPPITNPLPIIFLRLSLNHQVINQSDDYFLEMGEGQMRFSADNQDVPETPSLLFHSFLVLYRSHTSSQLYCVILRNVLENSKKSHWSLAPVDTAEPDAHRHSQYIYDGTRLSHRE